MLSLSRLLAAAASVAAAVTPAAVQAPTSAVALLAARDDHAIDAGLRQALLDPDPGTRMLAGRGRS